MRIARSLRHIGGDLILSEFCTHENEYQNLQPETGLKLLATAARCNLFYIDINFNYCDILNLVRFLVSPDVLGIRGN